MSERPRRDRCPHCQANIEVLPNGRLAWHYGQGPGMGTPCPPHDTTERLR